MNGDIDAKKDLKYKEINSNGYLWSLIISFDEEFAFNNGLITKGDYYNLTKNIMPSFLINMGFDLNNVTWYCAKHDNTKHPHLHINFFENSKKITNPKAPSNVLYNLKSKIMNYLIDNKKFYSLKDEIYSNILDNIDIKELTKIRKQRLFGDKYRSDLNKLLLNFYKIIPDKGRLQYNSKNMIPYKKYLNQIIEFILMHNSVKYSYSKYLNLLKQHEKELISMYGKSKYNNYYENQLNKLYSKIGNEILEKFKIYKSKDKIIKEFDFLKKHINEMNFKSRKYSKNETIINIGKGLYKLCVECELSYHETKKVFQKWIISSKYEFDIDALIGICANSNIEFSSSEYYSTLKKLGYDYNKYLKYKNKNFYRELEYKKFLNKAFTHLSHDLQQQEKMLVNEIEYELNLK